MFWAQKMSRRSRLPVVFSATAGYSVIMMHSLCLAALLATAAADGLPPIISVAPDAPVSDKHAAKELKVWLSRMCPDVPFKMGPPVQGANQIIVGPDAALSLGLPAASLAGLGNESYYLNLFTPPFAGSMVLSGGNRSTRGTLYAVYHLLTDTFSYDFLAHDETVVPACPDYVPHYEITDSPSFEYRDDNQWQVSTQSEWATRVGYNGPSSAQPDAKGGHLVYATPPGFVHTSYALLAYPERLPPTAGGPPAQLYAAHPEWFWPRGAKGGSTYGQLCWSNASLVAFVTAQARAILRAQPDASILSVSQNDNGNRCLDPAEEAVNRQAGSPIGALLIAVNTIAEALESEFPRPPYGGGSNRGPPWLGLRPAAELDLSRSPPPSLPRAQTWPSTHWHTSGRDQRRPAGSSRAPT